MAVLPPGVSAETFAAAVKEFEAAVGKKVLGNKPASGTAILDELGPEQIGRAHV